MLAGFARRLALTMVASVAVVTVASEGNAAKEVPSNLVVEMATPPADFATTAASLRSAAEAEIRAASPKTRRRVIVSMSVTKKDSTSLGCNVNATVRDAKTGAIFAIIESSSRADGPLSAETRKEMAMVAVRDAARKVPTALSSR